MTYRESCILSESLPYVDIELLSDVPGSLAGAILAVSSVLSTKLVSHDIVASYLEITITGDYLELVATDTMVLVVRRFYLDWQPEVKGAYHVRYTKDMEKALKEAKKNKITLRLRASGLEIGGFVAPYEDIRYPNWQRLCRYESIDYPVVSVDATKLLKIQTALNGVGIRIQTNKPCYPLVVRRIASQSGLALCMPTTDGVL